MNSRVGWVGLLAVGPLLAVAVAAARHGHPHLVTGGVVGANVAAVGLALGLAAVRRSLEPRSSVLWYAPPAMIGVSLLLLGLTADGSLGRVDGGVLLAVFAGLAAFAWRRLPAEPVRPLVLLPAAVAVALGGELAVPLAVEAADRLRVGEYVAGVLVVGVGAAVPVAVAAVVAAGRNQPDRAVGAVAAAFLANATLALGVAALVRPLPAVISLGRNELPAMLVFALLTLPAVANGLRFGRGQGAALLAAFAVFVGWQVRRAFGG